MHFVSTLSYGTIIADGLGKQFFGTNPLLLALVAVLLLTGAIACVARRDNARVLRIGLLVVTALISAGILVGAYADRFIFRNISTR